MTREEGLKYAQEIRKEKEELEEKRVDELVDRFIQTEFTHMSIYELANGIKDIYKRLWAMPSKTLTEIEQIVATLTDGVMFEDMSFGEYMKLLRDAFEKERTESDTNYFYVLYTNEDDNKPRIFTFENECVRFALDDSNQFMEFYDKDGRMVACFSVDRVKYIKRMYKGIPQY